MLSRVLESEVMDTAAEARDYDAMDHREVNRRFVDDLLTSLARTAPSGRRPLPMALLDLGTGTAQIPIELCRQADWFTVIAVDAARHMLDMAAQNIEAAGLVDRLHLQLADAKSLSFEDAHFDGVISNSIVHHLPEPSVALREAVRITRPGGFLFFRDLLRPASETELNALVDLYAPAAGASAATDHQRAMLADSLHAALALGEIRNLVGQLGFAAETVQQTSDRHWTWWAVRSSST